jgi:hypothetical protein
VSSPREKRIAGRYKKHLQALEEAGFPGSIEGNSIDIKLPNDWLLEITACGDFLPSRRDEDYGEWIFYLHTENGVYVDEVEIICSAEWHGRRGASLTPEELAGQAEVMIRPHLARLETLADLKAREARGVSVDSADQLLYGGPLEN